MEPDGLEPRVEALESEVRHLRDRVRAGEQDSAAARVLAGAADRDVADFGAELRDFRRGTIASFNALREDMTDLRSEVTDLRRHVDSGFAGVNDGFAQMRGLLDTTAAGQQELAVLLQQLIVDRD